MNNTNAIAEFENKAPAIRPVGAEIATTREAQEVQVAMVVAQRFPRDPVTAYNRIMADCSRRSLAEKAMYEYTRGGTTVTGPSIHLAKAMARGWGNLDSGFKVLESGPKESTVMSYCWDLETNYREARVFTVPNIRQTRNGSYPLTDPRDIYENIANQASRRERACILAIIPADVVDAAVGQCNATLNGNSDKPIIDRVRDMVKRFSDRFDITQDMLEAYIGRNADSFTVQSITRLQNVYNALKDGTQSVEDFKASIAPAKNGKKTGTADATAPEDKPAEDKQMGLDEL